MSNFWQVVRAHLENSSEFILNLLEKCGFDSPISFKNFDEFDELVKEIENYVAELEDDEAIKLSINLCNKSPKEFKLKYGEKCELIQMVKMIQEIPFSAFSNDKDIDNLLSSLKTKLQQDSSLADLLTWILSGEESEKLLKELLKTSIKNTKFQKSNRFSKEILLICTFLYLKIGKSSYEFLYNNLSLPSITTVKREIYDTYPKIKIGEIYAKELKEFLIERELPLIVGFAEDATRVKAELKYDQKLNQVLGVLIPCDENTGLPNSEVLFAETPEDVMNLCKGRPKALFAEVIVAQPMKKGAPTFILGLFPTNNEYSTNDTINRWKFIRNELSKEGISIAFISSDGAPTLLGAMKYLTNFGKIVNIFDLKIPLKLSSSFPCIQDSIHVLNKLKNKLINDTDEIRIGSYLATVRHLIDLINDKELTKLDHGLLLWDVDSSDTTRDKMDFDSTMRICNEKVLNLLKKKRFCLGTYMYLKMMNSFAKSFVMEGFNTEERVWNSVYVATFLRIWRKTLESQNLTGDNFISKNTWDCIELNNSFLIYSCTKQRGQQIPMCNSQGCESFFRDLRSSSSSGLTQLNFNFYDCIKKINKIQSLEILKHGLRKLGLWIKVKHDNLRQVSSEDSVNSQIEETNLNCDDNFTLDQLKRAIQIGQQIARTSAAICDLEESEVTLSSYFSLPNLQTSQRNNTINFFKKYFNTYEVEYEDIPLVDGEIVGTFLIYKNLKLLNIPQDHGCFQRLMHRSPDTFNDFKVSKFLYVVSEDIDKISNDRLKRFISKNRGEVEPEPIGDNIVQKRSAVSLGDFIFVKGKIINEIVCGKIVKFQYSLERTKMAKKYTYKSMFFNINQNVKFFLYPCFTIRSSGRLNSHDSPQNWFESNDYLCTINENYIDEEKKELSEEVLNYIRIL